MSASMNIAVDDRAAYEALARTRGALAARAAIHKVAAAAVGKLLRAHFQACNVRSPRSNYWANAAEAVSSEGDADSGRVVVRHPGIVWHRWGGTISAKPGKALAIPLRASVHGMRASERFPNRAEAFVFRRRGKAFLAAREGRALRIFYFLTKSVSKTQDPAVLPSTALLQSAVHASLRRLLVVR